MENDREASQVLMNVRNASGSIISASLMSTRLTLMLGIYLMRLAKKGLIAAGLADAFKDFSKNAEGKFTVYNIPLSAEKAEKITKLNELELKLQNATKTKEKMDLRNEMKKLRSEIPELEQLKKLGISHCVLPKLNGSNQTIQLAVATKHDQLFKNWFLNHLTTNLSGGEKGMEDLKVFTEGNVSIFNLPFEGDDLKTALSDFNTLGINYNVLPDLKIGDGNSQIAIPNADRSKLEMWFKMWRDQQIRAGKDPSEVGEFYEMTQESYANTSSVSQEDYVSNSEQKYQDANAEFEAKSTEVPWQTGGMQKENSEEFVRLMQDNTYEKITINKETLVKDLKASEKAKEMQKNGYFISRVPGTYGDREMTLILPENQVFRTDNDKTYIAFLPRNQSILMADRNGNVHKCSFEEGYIPYDVVKRRMQNVENYKKATKMTKDINLTKTQSSIPKPKAPVSPVPKL